MGTVDIDRQVLIRDEYTGEEYDFTVTTAFTKGVYLSIDTTPTEPRDHKAK